MSENLLAEITEVVEHKEVAGKDPITGRFQPGNKLAQNANPSPQKRVTAYLQRRLLGAADDMATLGEITDNIIAIARQTL